MAVLPNRMPFMLFKYSIALVTFFNFLAWLLVLGGISALEDVCHGGCRAAYGLPWFIIWYQFILLIPAFLIEFLDVYAAWRQTLNILLAINTVLAILQVDRFLDLKDSGNGSSRVNATIAGFIIQAIFNFLLIILSGSRTALNMSYGEDRDVGVATYPAKTRPTSPVATNGAPQVTVPPSQSNYGTTGPAANNVPANAV